MMQKVRNYQRYCKLGDDRRTRNDMKKWLLEKEITRSNSMSNFSAKSLTTGVLSLRKEEGEVF